MDQCVFCLIVAGKVPAKKVFEDDKVLVVLDINPASDGHLLVLPKVHAVSFLELDDSVVSHLCVVAKNMSHSLLNVLKAEGSSLFVADGVVAGQRAPHVMIHVIPRRSGDKLNLVLPEIELDDTSMKDAFVKLTSPKKEMSVKKNSLDDISELLVGK